MVDWVGSQGLIYAGRKGVVIHFNQAGNGWSEGRTIEGFRSQTRRPRAALRYLVLSVSEDLDN